MAAFGRHVILDSLRLSKSFTGYLPQFQLNYASCRLLYNQATLGIDNFARTRDRVKIQFVNMADRFRTKMGEYIQDDSKNMIFTEDLKNMVHLAEASPEDIDLILQMMLKFNNQNKEMRFGSFVFGPVVMRMYHFLNQPDAALKAFKDPALEGFFDQLISYQLLMDLLFVNGQYEEVLDVFDIVEKRQTQGARYPKHCVVLALGALYKMDSPESLKRALALWKNIQEAGHVPMRRATTFAAALAVNQGAPHVALEILGATRNQNYITVRNLKIAALSDVNRPEDALPIIRNLLQNDNPEQRRQTVSKSVLEKLNESINRQDNKEVIREYQRLEKGLIDGHHIQNETIADQLCSEISGSVPGALGFNQGMETRPRSRLAASWGRQGQQQQSPRNWRQDRPGMRPGLSELE